MGSLKPIGSEKLQGMDKIKRIIEISRYNEHLPNPVNENETKEYSRSLADGNRYEIVKEKSGYIIKQQINENFSDYIEPLKNRKYFSSYSQALKKLNLMAKELNTLHENKNEISLFGEEKKYYLKNSMMKKSDINPSDMDELEEQGQTLTPPPAPAPSPAPSPAPEPSPEPSPEGEEDMPEMEDQEDMEDEQDNEEEVTFKSIQKLTGKLAQKIRDFETKGLQDDEGMDGNDVKYVINSILSALDLTMLDEDDIDEIVSRFEESEPIELKTKKGTDQPIEPPSDESTEEPTPPTPPAEGEMSEMQNIGDRFTKKFEGAFSKTMGDNLMDEMYDEEDFGTMRSRYFDDEDEEDKFGFDDEEEEEDDDYTMRGARKHRRMYGDENHLSHGTFGESKVDKILKRYFEIEDKEKQLNEEKSKKIISENKLEIKRLSTTIPQERVAIKFLTENKNAELIGLSNKRNLIFRLNEDEFKISPKGTIL